MPPTVTTPRACRRCARLDGVAGVRVPVNPLGRCNICENLAYVCQVTGDAVPVGDVQRVYISHLRDHAIVGPAGREQLQVSQCRNCDMTCDGANFSIGRQFAADRPAGSAVPVVHTRHAGRSVPAGSVCNTCYGNQVSVVALGVYADSRSNILARIVNERAEVVRVLADSVPAGYAACSSCGLATHPAAMRRGICNVCRRSGVEGLSFNSRRQINLRLTESATSTLFPRITAVGLELETVVSANAVPDWLIENVPQIGWVGDGSIEVRGSRSGARAAYGVEFLSQPLAGSAVTSTLRDFARWAKGIQCAESDNAGGNWGRAWVNRSCGFHVHLDCSRFFSHNWETIKRFAMVWAAVQADIYRCLPASRRGRYSQELPADRLRELTAAGDEASLLRAWYGYEANVRSGFGSSAHLRDYNAQVERRRTNKYDESRYYGLNLHSWAHRGTVEIRCGSGTVDGLKAARWASVCVHLLKVAASGSEADCRAAKLVRIVPASVGAWLKARARRLHGEALAT